MSVTEVVQIIVLTVAIAGMLGFALGFSLCDRWNEAHKKMLKEIADDSERKCLAIRVDAIEKRMGK